MLDWGKHLQLPITIVVQMGEYPTNLRYKYKQTFYQIQSSMVLSSDDVPYDQEDTVDFLHKMLSKYCTSSAHPTYIIEQIICTSVGTIQV